jgi:hypothetical protein
VRRVWREAQEKGGIRVGFLLVTFLCPNKEKSLAQEGETNAMVTLQNSIHASDQSNSTPSQYASTLP